MHGMIHRLKVIRTNSRALKRDPQTETPEQALSEGEVAYNYDEWDRELTDHRVGWCGR